ncbi:unnamed protein product [Pylaiella littoralis]
MITGGDNSGGGGGGGSGPAAPYAYNNDMLALQDQPQQQQVQQQQAEVEGGYGAPNHGSPYGMDGGGAGMGGVSGDMLALQDQPQQQVQQQQAEGAGGYGAPNHGAPYGMDGGGAGMGGVSGDMLTLQDQPQQQQVQQQQAEGVGGNGAPNHGAPYGMDGGGAGMGGVSGDSFGGGYGGGDGVGVGGGGAVAQGGGGPPVGVPAEMTAQVVSWLSALMVSDKGILFEGGPIKIGVVHEYRSSQGRLTLYLYNLSGSPLTDLRVEVPTVPFLRSQIGQGPAALDVGGKAQQVLMCECLQPFADAPGLTVSFSSEGRQFSLGLTLPLSVCSFIEPLQLGAEDFARRWEMLGNASKEEAAEVWGGAPVTAERWSEIRGIVTSAIKMGVTDEPDPSDSNSHAGSSSSTQLRAAGTLRTGSLTPQGHKISLGAMLRLEVEPTSGTFRIFVRAVHGTVAVGLRQMLAAQLVAGAGGGGGGDGGGGGGGGVMGAGGVGA